MVCLLAQGVVSLFNVKAGVCVVGSHVQGTNLYACWCAHGLAKRRAGSCELMLGCIAKAKDDAVTNTGEVSGSQTVHMRHIAKAKGGALSGIEGVCLGTSVCVQRGTVHCAG